MRHRRAGRKLSRNSSHRKAMLRNLVTSLLKHEQLETTDARAKELRPVAEKIITLAKRGDLHARRQAMGYIKEKAVTHRLFEELKERYVDRTGGYVRIIKKGTRKGDGAPISIMQLLPEEEGKKKTKKKGKVTRSPRAAGRKKKKETEGSKAGKGASEKKQPKEGETEVKSSDSESKKEKS